MLEIPRFSDFFKSFYYSNTYLPAVELSESTLAKDLIDDPKTEQIVQNLISLPEVQAILSQPWENEPKEINARKEVLRDYYFDFLGKHPFYQVEHQRLPHYIIKPGASRIVPNGTPGSLKNDLNETLIFNKEDSLLSIEMDRRIAKIAHEANLDVICPKRKLVSYLNSNQEHDLTKKYCLISEKLDVLSAEETIQAIQGMEAKEQVTLAKKISTLIQKVGLANASFDNIRLTRAGQIALIDVDSIGLMIKKRTKREEGLDQPIQASVEKCARIGLFILLRGTKNTGLDSFTKQIAQDYEVVSRPKLSHWKIALNIAIPVIPLINAIVAAYKWRAAHRLISEYSRVKALISTNARFPKFQNQTANHLLKQYLALIEGVPFTRHH